MVTEQEELTLRFRAGKFEQHVLSAILVLQVTLAAMACLAVLWTVHVTIGAYFDPQRATLLYAHWMGYPLGAAVGIYVLNLLYK